MRLVPSRAGSEENLSEGIDRASVYRNVASGDRGRCNEIEGSQGPENAESTSLA